MGKTICYLPSFRRTKLQISEGTPYINKATWLVGLDLAPLLSSELPSLSLWRERGTATKKIYYQILTSSYPNIIKNKLLPESYIYKWRWQAKHLQIRWHTRDQICGEHTWDEGNNHHNEVFPGNKNNTTGTTITSILLLTALLKSHWYWTIKEQRYCKSAFFQKDPAHRHAHIHQSNHT